MACLSKHGEYTKFEFPRYNKAYCEDGAVLINYGSGWKLYGKLKMAYADAIKGIKAKQAAVGPSSQKLYAELFRMAGTLKNRCMLCQALEAYAHDPDGMFVELDEMYGSNKWNRDEIKNLCFLFGVAQVELEHKTKG